jgi:hypothetical protein
MLEFLGKGPGDNSWHASGEDSSLSPLAKEGAPEDLTNFHRGVKIPLNPALEKRGFKGFPGNFHSSFSQGRSHGA